MTTDQDTPESTESLEEPGSRLLTPMRYEIMAQCISRGVSAVDAYVKAGFKFNYGNAARLAREQRIQIRANWLRDQLAKAQVFDTIWIKERLGLLADSLSEIIVDPASGQRKPGPLFNAAQANRALELLGREAGIFKDKIELGGQVQVANRDLFERMTPPERAFMREMLMKAAGRLPEPANDDAVQEAAPEPEQGGVVPVAK